MKIALVTLVKNEQPYMQEWVDFHLTMGFDQIFVVEDFGSKSHSFVENDKCQVIKLEEIMDPNSFSRHSIQRDLANYYVCTLRKDYDWMAYIDADEYIMSYKDLHEVLEQYNDQVGIAMKWHNYNANGHFHRPEGAILLNYTQNCVVNRKDWTFWEHKSFGNLHKDPEWKDPHRLKQYINVYDIWVNHYICKSFQDYCYKIYARGDVYHRVYRSFENFIELNPDFDVQELKDYVLNEYKTLDEYVQISEDPIVGVTPKKTSGKQIYAYPHYMKLSNVGQTVQIHFRKTDDCGKVYLDDCFGLYDAEIKGNWIKLHAKHFDGGSGIIHKIKLRGENGGEELLIIERHGYNKRNRAIPSNNSGQ